MIGKDYVGVGIYFFATKKAVDRSQLK